MSDTDVLPALKPMPVLAGTCVSLIFALCLTACGGGGATRSEVDACALITDSQSLFGANAESESIAPLDDIAGACRWRAADGRRGADLIVYTAHSLRTETPASRFSHITQSWDAMTQTPLAPIAGLGDEAQLARDLPGYQTQAVIRKGDKVAALLAWSGDPALDGEALARRMASEAAGRL